MGVERGDGERHHVEHEHRQEDVEEEDVEEEGGGLGLGRLLLAAGELHIDKGASSFSSFHGRARAPAMMGDGQDRARADGVAKEQR